jgi:hypothetical protein
MNYKDLIKQSLKIVPVETEFGIFKIKMLSAKERIEWEQSAFDKDGVAKIDAREQFLASCLVDDEGKKLYTTEEKAQLAEDIHPSLLTQLFEKAIEENKIGKKATEETKKN